MHECPLQMYEEHLSRDNVWLLQCNAKTNKRNHSKQHPSFIEAMTSLLYQNLVKMCKIFPLKGPLKPGLGRMIAEDPSIQATVWVLFPCWCNCLYFQTVLIWWIVFAFCFWFCKRFVLRLINQGTWGAWGRPWILLHIHLLSNRWGLAKSMNQAT